MLTNSLTDVSDNMTTQPLNQILQSSFDELDSNNFIGLLVNITARRIQLKGNRSSYLVQLHVYDSSASVTIRLWKEQRPANIVSGSIILFMGAAMASAGDAFKCRSPLLDCRRAVCLMHPALHHPLAMHAAQSDAYESYLPAHPQMKTYVISLIAWTLASEFALLLDRKAVEATNIIHLTDPKVSVHQRINIHINVRAADIIFLSTEEIRPVTVTDTVGMRCSLSFSTKSVRASFISRIKTAAEATPNLFLRNVRIDAVYEGAVRRLLCDEGSEICSSGSDHAVAPTRLYLTVSEAKKILEDPDMRRRYSGTLLEIECVLRSVKFNLVDGDISSICIINRVMKGLRKRSIDSVEYKGVEFTFTTSLDGIEELCELSVIADDNIIQQLLAGIPATLLVCQSGLDATVRYDKLVSNIIRGIERSASNYDLYLATIGVDASLNGSAILKSLIAK